MLFLAKFGDFWYVAWGETGLVWNESTLNHMKQVMIQILYVLMSTLTPFQVHFQVQYVVGDFDSVSFFQALLLNESMTIASYFLVIWWFILQENWAPNVLIQQSCLLNLSDVLL